MSSRRFIAYLASALVLAASYGVVYVRLAAAADPTTCQGLGFGCRPSPEFSVGLAALVTLPLWMAITALSEWLYRRLSPSATDRRARLPVEWAPLVFSTAVMIWGVTAT